MTSKLPPLPEPLIQHPVTFGILVGYTQDQMREYAQNAIFAANDEAKVAASAPHSSEAATTANDALERAALLAEQWGNARMPDGGGNALRNCAEAIRALKNTVSIGEAGGVVAEPVAWRYKKTWEPLAMWKVTDQPLTEYQRDTGDYEIVLLYAAQPQAAPSGLSTTTQELLPGTFASAEELIMALRSDRAIFGLNDGQLNEILVEAQRLTDDWAERQLIDPIRVETNAHCVKEIVRLIYMAKQP